MILANRHAWIQEQQSGLRFQRHLDQIGIAALNHPMWIVVTKFPNITGRLLVGAQFCGGVRLPGYGVQIQVRARTLEACFHLTGELAGQGAFSRA